LPGLELDGIRLRMIPVNYRRSSDLTLGKDDRPRHKTDDQTTPSNPG
jgi:hypothetical protein